MQAVSPWYTPPQQKARKGVRGSEDVIGAFNETVSLQAALERNGYMQKGERYLAPSSSTGVPGVSILEGVCYSHHASDPLNDGYAHDAFDVMRLLECGGDSKAALDKARDELGLEPFKPDGRDKGKSQPKERKLNLVFMDTVQSEAVSFLWRPYIPLGKMTLLEGDPGLGKTFIALTLTSILTNGYPFPDVSSGEFAMTPNPLPPSTVIYMTAEDGLADTLKPRLEKAGGGLLKGGCA